MNNSESKSNSLNQQVSLAEHLSSVLDDEAGSFEQRRVLDELKSNQDLSEKLSHFALIGESMRSTKPVAIAGTDFLAGIHEKISSEDEYHDVQLLDSTDSDPQQKSWLRPVGGFALAASFAAIAFVGIQNYQLNNQLLEQNATMTASNSEPQQALKVEMQTAVVTPVKTPPVENKATDEYRQANAHARSFLKRYVDSHVQYASTSTFVPSVRVIAYADY